MTRPRSHVTLLWSLAFANSVAVIVVCMLWVDRPVADRVNVFMQGQPPWLDWTSRALGSLPIVLISAALILLWWGIQRARGRPLPGWADTPLRSAISLTVALSVALPLKFLIGRSQVYPPWIERGEYGFFPMRGVHGYGAFPSATMAVAAAVLSVVWIRYPRQRAVPVLLVALVALAIIMTNGHWLSDVIGGGFLGCFTGWLLVRFWRPTCANP